MPGPNRFSSWFGGQFCSWELTRGVPVAYPDLHYWADVMSALDQAMPDAGLHVIVTDELVAPPPSVGLDVVVLCLGDELAVPPRYAHQVRLVAKTMGGRRRRPFVALWPARRWPALPMAIAQEALVQTRRAPWLARDLAATARSARRADVLDVPIGIRAYADVRERPFDQRRYDVAFAGSMVNEAREHERRWASQKLRARRAFLAEIERLRQDRPALSVWLRVVPTHWDGATATGSYAEALADSRIVLCPRGSSVDTHRYFEALRAGCVPVYEMLPRRDYYDGAPGVRIRDWSRLGPVVDELLADPVALREQHEAALRWYDRWVSPPAVAGRIASHLGAAAVTPAA